MDGAGRARMVDVSEKPATVRTAVAEGAIRMSLEAFGLIAEGAVEKGDVLGVCEIAGTLAVGAGEITLAGEQVRRGARFEAHCPHRVHDLLEAEPVANETGRRDEAKHVALAQAGRLVRRRQGRRDRGDSERGSSCAQAGQRASPRQIGASHEKRS